MEFQILSWFAQTYATRVNCGMLVLIKKMEQGVHRSVVAMSGLLITFSSAVRKMFRTRVIFGGTMDNYISMVMKGYEM